MSTFTLTHFIQKFSLPALTAVGIFGISFGANATSKASAAIRQSMKHARGSTSVELPKGWKVVEHLYGLPWTIVGPDHSGGDPNLKEDDQARRSVIAVIPTGKTNLVIDPGSAEKSQVAYFESRKSAVEKAGGSIRERIPYAHQIWSDGKIDVHQIGLKFQQGTSKLTEVSYHVVCGKKLYMLKSMISDEDLGVDRPAIERILRSFQCE